jgi:hypothetical protein
MNVRRRNLLLVTSLLLVLGFSLSWNPQTGIQRQNTVGNTTLSSEDASAQVFALTEILGKFPGVKIKYNKINEVKNDKATGNVEVTYLATQEQTEAQGIVNDCKFCGKIYSLILPAEQTKDHLSLRWKIAENLQNRPEMAAVSSPAPAERAERQDPLVAPITTPSKRVSKRDNDGSPVNDIVMKTICDQDDLSDQIDCAKDALDQVVDETCSEFSSKRSEQEKKANLCANALASLYSKRATNFARILADGLASNNRGERSAAISLRDAFLKQLSKSKKTTATDQIRRELIAKTKEGMLAYAKDFYEQKKRDGYPEMTARQMVRQEINNEMTGSNAAGLCQSLSGRMCDYNLLQSWRTQVNPMFLTDEQTRLFASDLQSPIRGWSSQPDNGYMPMQFDGNFMTGNSLYNPYGQQGGAYNPYGQYNPYGMQGGRFSNQTVMGANRPGGVFRSATMGNIGAAGMLGNISSYPMYNAGLPMGVGAPGMMNPSYGGFGNPGFMQNPGYMGNPGYMAPTIPGASPGLGGMPGVGPYAPYNSGMAAPGAFGGAPYAPGMPATGAIGAGMPAPGMGGMYQQVRPGSGIPMNPQQQQPYGSNFRGIFQQQR